MAKAIQFTEEEPVDLSGLEQPKEVTDEEIEELFGGFDPIKVEETKPIIEYVDVTPIRDFRTSYAGVWYYFSKGKKQKVPNYVRDFLLMDKQNPKIKDVW